MRIGIINMQYSRHNYGALLQASALQSAIQGLHPDACVEHIDIRAPWQNPRVMQKRVSYLKRVFNLLKNLFLNWPAIPSIGNFEVFSNYRNKYVKRTPKAYLTDENFANEDWNYDIVVVGSDQVFRAHYVKHDWNIYFLSFLPKACRRVSYAGSFGVDHWEAADEVTLTENVRKAFACFSSISVREESGVSICKEQFGVEAEHVLDPTLLVGREYFDNMIEAETVAKEMPDWAVHIISSDAQSAAAIIQYAQRHEKSILNIYYERHNRWPLRPTATFRTVPEWLRYIRDAQELVLTDSYHCVCFCILFKKEFLVFMSMEKGASRMYSLLSMLGLEDRICMDQKSLEEAVFDKRTINYDLIQSVLKSERLNSWEFLKRSLT